MALASAIVAASLLAPTAASAHSSVVGSSPEGATGEPGTVEVLPESVSITFSDDLTEPLPADQQQGAQSNTQLRVFDESCTAVADLDTEELAAGAADCHDYATGDAVVEGPTLSQQLEVAGAPAGTYTVVWQAVYGDGHPDSGAFTFVADSAAAERTADPADPTADATATPTARASDAPPAETSPDTDTSTDVDDTEGSAIPLVIAIVGGVILLALVAFIIVMITRSRRS